MNYKYMIGEVNRLFKKYSLQYEMREVKDKDYGTVCKIYFLPYKGRARCVSTGMGPGPALQYFTQYFYGPEKSQVQFVYRDFCNLC